jgi:ADP-ribose pyrophosphatase YjhB (NUDIX family)
MAGRMLWRRRIEPYYRPLFFAYARTMRGLTFGVRAVVTDEDGRVLLIEHTYVPGWHLPGGGVERGETFETAVARELEEEAGVRATTRPRLLSLHDNGRRFPGDHVALYRVDGFTACDATGRGEIHDRGWFAPDALPAGTGPSTRRRIEEALLGREPDPLW